MGVNVSLFLFVVSQESCCSHAESPPLTSGPHVCRQSHRKVAPEGDSIRSLVTPHPPPRPGDGVNPSSDVLEGALGASPHNLC